MTTIVVGMDGSDHAAEALRWAAREHSLRGGTLTAVLAWGLLDQHHAAVGERFDPSYGRAEALAALDTFVTAALGPEGEGAVTRKVVCDLPTRGLLEAAAGADLLVLGARGLGGFKGLLLGSVSQYCLHHSAVPVAIIRGSSSQEPEGRRERMVVGVDGSDAARDALRWAAAEARVRGAMLEVVSAWQPPLHRFVPYTVVDLEPPDFEDAAKRILDDALEAIDVRDLAVVPVVVGGSGASVILERAEGADLVVVGSRGLGGVKSRLLGSVSNQVVHHSPCPVVVVPPDS